MYRSLVLLLFTSLLQAQDVSKLELNRVQAEAVTFQGKKAIRLTEAADATQGGELSLAVLKGVKFHNGEISLYMASEPGAKAATDARGFVGISFRMQGAAKFETIYIRPTNGRAEDQVRRNHSIQYTSTPDFPWFRLRKEFPEKYESYADMQPGTWTQLRVTVDGTKARAYVNGAAQPQLIVNDLKLGDSEGGVALWIGPGTVAHFTWPEIK